MAQMKSSGQWVLLSLPTSATCSTCKASCAVVLLVTQCGHGGVRPALYEAGRAALEAGAVAGHDLTVEAALVKSMHLLAQGLSPSELRSALPTDLAGELTAETDGGEGSP